MAAIAIVVAGCGQDRLPQSPSPIPSQSPSRSPSPPPPPAPASVFIQSVTAFRESLSSQTDAYHVGFVLRETGGSTGATIKAIELAFANGLNATFGPEVAQMNRVTPGGTVPLDGLSMTAANTSRAGSVQIRVLLTDDGGVDSVSMAAASVTATYHVSGRVTDSATGRPLAGAVVTVTFGGASGRTAISDAVGYYLLQAIPVGSVSFNVSVPGFVTATRTATVQADTTVDVSLTRIS